MNRIRIEPDDFLDSVARQVVNSAIKVHIALGPGLMEAVYEKCLLFELHSRNLNVQTQVDLPIVYRGCKIDQGLRIDMLVEGCLIVEIKAVEQLLPVHHAQVLTYLKLTGNNLGLLVNFNTVRMRDGIKRIVHTVRIRD